MLRTIDFFNLYQKKKYPDISYDNGDLIIAFKGVSDVYDNLRF